MGVGWGCYPCKVQLGWGTLTGGTPPQVPPPWTSLGGTPPRVPPSDLAGGYPDRGGTPPQVPPSDLARGHQPWIPPSDLAGGSPMGGTPPWVPSIRPGQGGTLTGGTPSRVPPHHWTWLGGTLTGGVPHLGYPPVGPGQGVPQQGVPQWGGGTPSRVVLDTARSACLLRSRRRTFLLRQSSTKEVLVHSWMVHKGGLERSTGPSTLHVFLMFKFFEIFQDIIARTLCVRKVFSVCVSADGGTGSGSYRPHPGQDQS